MKLRDFSLKKLFIIALGTLAVLNALFLVIIYPSLFAVDKTNMAGYTRTLSQNILLNITAYINSGDAARLEQAKKSVEVMDGLLFVLEKGGSVPEFPNMEVAPCEDLEEKARLDEIKSFWEPYRTHTRTVISGGSSMGASMNFNSSRDSLVWEGMQKSFYFLETNNEQLLTSAKALALFYTEQHSGKNRFIGNNLIGFATSFILVMALSYLLFSHLLFKPLEQLTETAKTIAAGDYSTPHLTDSDNELGKLGLVFHSLITKFTEIHKFTTELGKDNFGYRFDPAKLSEKDIQADELLRSLLETQRLLSAAKEEGKQKQWMSEGTAIFADAIRQNNDNMKELCQDVLAKMIKYTGANQGAIMLHQQEGGKDYLVMEAQYAYSRKKYADKKMKVGEGLAGQIFLEKQTLYMSKVPDDYIQIQSSLGGASPKYLLIVPLIADKKAVGILEIASFNPIEKYHIELIEKVSDNLANALLNVGKNEQTKALLEETQEKTEQLRAAEEEMRQNMEELSATQETLQRNSEESEALRDLFEKRFQAIDKTVLVSETDLFGTITYVNKLCCKESGYTFNELVGKTHKIVRHPDNPASFYKEMWAALKAGKGFDARYKNLRKDGSHYWIRDYIVPLTDRNGAIEKYMAIRYLIPERDGPAAGTAFEVS